MELSCKSFWPHDLQHPTHLIVIVSIIAVITLILNLLLIYSLFKTRQTHTNTFRFIIAMSVSDVLLGAFVMPATAVAISIRGDGKSCRLDQSTQFGLYIFTYFSFFMLVSITFDRLYQIRSLRISARTFSSKQIFGILTAILAFSIIWTYFAIINISFDYQMFVVSFNVCLFLIMMISCACLIRKVRIHNLTVASNLGKSSLRSRISARIEINASKVVWVLLMTIIVSYLPINIVTPWLSYVRYKKRERPNSEMSASLMWACIFEFAYASVNAFIFIMTNCKIKRFLWRRIVMVLTNKESSVYATGHEARTIQNHMQKMKKNAIAPL